MKQVSIGDNAPNQVDLVSLYVQNGGSGTVVSNLSGSSTLNVYTSLEAAASSTIAASANATFTQTPVWIGSQGISAAQISGPGY